MSQPTQPPGTPQGPWHPRTFPVPLKACCQVLVGEVCECAAWAVEAEEALASPIRFGWTGGALEVTCG